MVINKVSRRQFDHVLILQSTRGLSVSGIFEEKKGKTKILLHIISSYS